MKKKMMIGLSFVIAGMAMSGYSAVVSNLLADAGFEGLTGNEPSAGTAPWFTINENADWTIKPSTAYSVEGLQSVEVVNYDSAAIVQNTGVQIESNTTYSGIAWIRTSVTNTTPQIDAPKLTMSVFTSPTIDGTYTYRKGFFFNQANTTVDVWEKISGVLLPADFATWVGEYVQIRLVKNDAGTSHNLYIDAVEFGEFEADPVPPTPAPPGLLIGFYGSVNTNDYHAEGIGGTLFTNTIYQASIAAGSDDGTYGTIGSSSNGAPTVVGGYEVRIGANPTAAKLTVRFSIENNSGGPLQLSSINFDYSRFFANGPKDIELVYAYGALTGVDSNTVINAAIDVPVAGKYADYNDYDWSLAGLADTVLMVGESATFELVAANPVGQYDSGAFDNIGIFGEVVTVGYASWATGYGGVGQEGEDDDHDGLINLYEYGLGGNPTNGIVDGNLPTFWQTGGGLEYVYAQRTDDASLSYWLELSGDLLVIGSWTNDGYTVVATNLTGGTFDYVTNSIPTADAKKFIRLMIQN